MGRAKVIGFHSEKGGVCKTTGALNFCNLTAIAGKKVVLIDIDHSQGTASKHILDIKRYPERFYKGILPNGKRSDLLKLQSVNYFKREQPLEKILIEVRRNFWLMPTWGIDRKFTRWTENEMSNPSNQTFLKRLISQLETLSFDYIIFDLSPSFGAVQDYFYLIADEVITPILADGYALDGYISVNTKIDEMDIIRQEVGMPSITRNKITLNQYDERNNSGKKILKEFNEINPNIQVIVTPVNEEVKRLRASHQFVSENVKTMNVNVAYVDLTMKILKGYGDV